MNAKKYTKKAKKRLYFGFVKNRCTFAVGIYSLTFKFFFMDIIYLKIKVRKSDTDTDEVREEGLFFERVADALCLSRDAIEEIEPEDFSRLAKYYQQKKRKNDQSRSGKRTPKK